MDRLDIQLENYRPISIAEACVHGYTNNKVVKLRGVDIICGLMRFAFTTGLVIGIDDTGYIGRYCFHTKSEAERALRELTIIPSNLIIEGNWIKFKGYTEISNPNYENEKYHHGPADCAQPISKRANKSNFTPSREGFSS
jgi:hypothetical protein